MDISFEQNKTKPGTKLNPVQVTCSSCHQPWSGFSHGRGRSCTRSTRTVLSSWWISTLKSKQLSFTIDIFGVFLFHQLFTQNLDLRSRKHFTFNHWFDEIYSVEDIVRFKPKFIFSDCSVGAWLLLFFCGGCVKFILCVAAISGQG